MKVLIGGNPMGLEKAIPDLSKKYPQVEFEYYPSRDIPHDLFATADVYVGWLNRDLYLAGKKLKWIQSPSSGVNYYTAIPELVASDVLLTSASGTHGACLAESVFGMIFAFTRHIKDFPGQAKGPRVVAAAVSPHDDRADRQHHGHHRLWPRGPRHRQTRRRL
jgi:phosphoglycerate dehydrogenase-like enzyme